MRHAMLRGVAAVFAATIGISLYAQDNQPAYNASDADTAGAQAEVSADVQAAPSTQPLEQSHMNDLPAERAVGTEEALDNEAQPAADAQPGNAQATPSEQNGDRSHMNDLPGERAIGTVEAEHIGQDQSQQSSESTEATPSGQNGDRSYMNDLPGERAIGTVESEHIGQDNAQPSAGASDMSNGNDMGNADNLSQQDGANLNNGTDQNLNNDGTSAGMAADREEGSLGASGSVDVNAGADVNDHSDASVSGDADLNAQPAADRDLGNNATTQPSAADSDATDRSSHMIDSPNDAAPNEQGQRGLYGQDSGTDQSSETGGANSQGQP